MCMLLGGSILIPVTVKAEEGNKDDIQLMSQSNQYTSIQSGDSSTLESEFSYEENADGTLTITGYSDKTATMLDIPEEIDGKKVTAIGKLTLEEDCPLETIKIPASIKSINKEAFRHIIDEDAWTTFPIDIQTEPGSYAEKWIIHHQYGATMTTEKISKNDGKLQLRVKVFNKTTQQIDARIDVSLSHNDAFTSFGTYEGDSVKYEDAEWKVLLKAGTTTEFLIKGVLPDTWGEGDYLSLNVQIWSEEEELTGDLVCGTTYSYWEDKDDENNEHIHHYGDWQTIKEPTYTEKGLRTKTCTECNDVLSEEIPMLVKPVDTPAVPVQQPTPAQAPVASTNAPQVGTVVKQGTDSYQITSTESGDMTVTYTGSDDISAKTVTVPDKVVIDGREYTVTDITSDAFKNNKKVTNIKIGKNVTKIGKNAFKNCKNLKKITITSTKLTKKSIGKNAFKGTNGKLVIKVPKNKKKEYAKFLKDKGNKRIVIK